ncbi:MAG: urease accessory protein [Gammaproteobacteria bacterium]|jgi:urease accessory protein
MALRYSQSVQGLIPAGTAANSEEGWQAKLHCQFDAGPNKTIVRRSHVGPLSVQRPFYPEGDVAHVYMLHPPGGVVGGDQLLVDVQVNANAAGLLTTPGATKFYRTDGKRACVKQRLANQGGSLEWFPQENIFFDGANVKLDTQVKTSSSSPLAFWEINCFGRRAGNLPFKRGSIVTKLSVYRDSILTLLDRFVLNDGATLTRSTGLRANTVSGLMLLSPLPAESVDAARSELSNESAFCMTCIDDMLLVRYLGDSAEHAKAGFVKIWTQQRMGLSKRKACAPRIWLT